MNVSALKILEKEVNEAANQQLSFKEFNQPFSF
jgi:hypothetical protein